MIDAAPIAARGLYKSFGNAPVLRGVELSVAAGTAALIIGRNGAGKSTLLGILAGLWSSDDGAAMLFDEASTALTSATRRRVGMVTHQSFLYPNLTGRENLEFFCMLYGVADARVAVPRALERVGLATAADDRVRTFSRGMEQRLTLARAMIHRPDALLMDEPFAALDAEGIAIATGLIREALARGCAIVATAHQLLAIAGLDFAVYEIERGRLLAHPPDRFTERGGSTDPRARTG
jgi:heme exporter protein A